LKISNFGVFKKPESWGASGLMKLVETWQNDSKYKVVCVRCLEKYASKRLGKNRVKVLRVITFRAGLGYFRIFSGFLNQSVRKLTRVKLRLN